MRRCWSILLVAIALLANGLTAQDRREGALKPGDPAPDFTLEPRAGGAPITLSAFRNKMPVALVFGSYT